MSSLKSIEIRSPVQEQAQSILTPEALEFITTLQQKFQMNRQELLTKRKQRQRQFEEGEVPDFLSETKNIRQSHWQVAEIPPDLQDRRVEITGPAERKMMINALNSGAKVFMADLEDALSPTWENVIQAQINLKEAVRYTLSYQAPDGKKYELKPEKEIATLFIRPRGWHLEEKNVWSQGEPVSASLFDFGLYFFHNAKERIRRGTAPYFYLPKLESHLEARLWNDVFCFAENALNIPIGTIRATVLIETIVAAFEMDEILWELKDHSAGLNAGRWDYIFSIIKKFKKQKEFILPDRAQVTMTAPFMRAYTQLLVQTCHKRKAHAMGGMAAFVPSRKDPEVNRQAFQKVREDKEREATDSFDGTWVAHPDLVSVAQNVFDKVLGQKYNQIERKINDVKIGKQELLLVYMANGKVTEMGVRNNIRVALQYLNSWLQGAGAVAIDHLMEDTATAEICRSQLWQWLHHTVLLAEGQKFTKELYVKWRDEEIKQCDSSSPRFLEAVQLLNHLVEQREFSEFLTIPAYEYLNPGGTSRC